MVSGAEGVSLFGDEYEKESRVRRRGVAVVREIASARKMLKDERSKRMRLSERAWQRRHGPCSPTPKQPSVHGSPPALRSRPFSTGLPAAHQTMKSRTHA